MAITKIGKNTVNSFKFAYQGLRAVFENEANFRIHLLISILALILAVALNLNYLEIAILVMVIALVLILELVNTAIEETINLTSPDINEKAKLIKDVSAAGVLLSAILSIIIGLLLFFPKIISLILAS